jgi:hypothetical protein
MRYSELTNEAPMNPGEFNKAIDTGHDKGVLVGFEFECVVPKKTIVGSRGVGPTHTKEEVEDIFGENDYVENMYVSSFSPKKFDKLFTFAQGNSKYPNMVEAYDAYIQNLIAKIKVMFDKIPAAIRAKENANAKEASGDSDRYQPGANKQINFAYHLGRLVMHNYNKREKGGSKALSELGEKMLTLAREGDTCYVDLFKFVFPRQDYNAISRFLDFDPDVVYNKLDLKDYVDDFGDDDDDYQGAARVLTPIIEKTQGRKVIVFDSYHEHKKNMTDWYIEPDGSLEADNDGDGTVEVVSPPLPAKDAITALKNFYAMAGQLGIYTNQSTGLHINVSIPETLDILKLAVFAGDQYVLKNFNRLNSDYAQSVTREIPQQANGRAISVDKGPKKDPNLFGQRKQNTEINSKLLQRIAKEISNDHMASISYNGKWVSFRHAGGNYLKDYTEIYNVVGRFVRAIIIASDPALYANEYNAAVAKMAAPEVTVPQDLQATVNYIMTKGLPVIEVQLAYKGDGNPDLKKMFKFVANASGTMPSYQSITPAQLEFIPNSPTAKQKMSDKAVSGGSFMTWAETATPDKFGTVILMPKNEYQVALFLRRNYPNTVWNTLNRYRTKDGFYAISLGHLPATDPRARKMMLEIRKQYYREKKQRR